MSAYDANRDPDQDQDQDPGRDPDRDPLQHAIQDLTSTFSIGARGMEMGALIQHRPDGVRLLLWDPLGWNQRSIERLARDLEMED